MMACVKHKSAYVESNLNPTPAPGRWLSYSLALGCLGLALWLSDSYPSHPPHLSEQLLLQNQTRHRAFQLVSSFLLYLAVNSDPERQWTSNHDFQRMAVAACEQALSSVPFRR